MHLCALDESSLSIGRVNCAVCLSSYILSLLSVSTGHSHNHRSQENAASNEGVPHRNERKHSSRLQTIQGRLFLRKIIKIQSLVLMHRDFFDQCGQVLSVANTGGWFPGFKEPKE